MPYRVTVWECGHTTPNHGAPVSLASERYCERCRKVVRAIEEHDGYKVRCHGCRYARTYGVARLTALRAADRHAREHRTHRVTVTHGSRVVLATCFEEQNDELPEEPPF